MTGSQLLRQPLVFALVALAGICLASAGTLAPSALAQGVAPPASRTDAKGYKYLAPYVDPTLTPLLAAKEKAKIFTAEQLVRRVISGQAGLAESKPQFDFYYARMYFPEFTSTTDEALKKLPVERQKLFANHLEDCTSPTVHKYLVETIFTQMKDIVRDNYHPACRYNAMLIISGLNSVDAITVGGDKKTPEPLIEALPFILEEYTKADNSDAIRMAALLGLVRHLEWDNFRGPIDAPTPAIVPQTRDAIVKELLALALATEPPAGREAAGHEWFRRRAIEGLTYASHNQVDPAVAAAFEKLLKDESESLAIRCAAAAAIGKVVYNAPAKLEPTPTAKELGYLALVACDKELTRVANLNKEEDDKLMRLSGTNGSYGSGSGGYAEGGMGSAGRGARGGRGTSSEGSYPSGGRGARGGRSGPGGMSSGSGRSGYPGGSSSGYPGMSSGSMGSEGGYGVLVPEDPKQYRFDLVRRRLRAQLYAVEIGFGGPDANLKSVSPMAKPADPPAPNAGPLRGVEAIAKGTPDEEPVKEISKLVGELAKAVEATTTDMAALEKELRKQMKPLEAKTRKLAAPVAPVEVTADEPAAPVAAPAKPAPGKPAPAATPADGPAPPAPAPSAPPASAPAPGGPAPGAPKTPTPPAPGAPATPAAPPASAPAAAPAR